MKILKTVPAILLAVGLGACDSDVLDVRPVDRIDAEIAITDVGSAQAALLGAYSALQDNDLYGGGYVMFGDLMADNAEHEGTFDSFDEADRMQLVAANTQIYLSWIALYRGINRANVLIERVPELDADLPGEQEEFDRILGEAHALRALHYHNLVRAWGDVPLVLTPPATVEEAGLVTRSSESAVYTQILADLDAAEGYFTAAGIGNSDRTFATPGFVDALRSRVYLYMEDWAAAESAARDVMAAGYGLATDYASLFTATHTDTDEDIFRVVFDVGDINDFGYYYQYAGRFEIGATQDIFNAYPAGDERPGVIFGASNAPGEREVMKYPTTSGTEDVHVIRYAEVLLNLAEALARQGGAANLDEAVTYLNQVRERAGLAPYDRAAGDLPTQAAVIDAIVFERRLELAFEGDRWFDLVRRGQAVAVLGIPASESWRTLWPIPQQELDVAPNMTQNPNY